MTLRIGCCYLKRLFCTDQPVPVNLSQGRDYTLLEFTERNVDSFNAYCSVPETLLRFVVKLAKCFRKRPRKRKSEDFYWHFCSVWGSTLYDGFLFCTTLFRNGQVLASVNIWYHRAPKECLALSNTIVPSSVKAREKPCLSGTWVPWCSGDWPGALSSRWKVQTLGVGGCHENGQSVCEGWEKIGGQPRAPFFNTAGQQTARPDSWPCNSHHPAKR